MSSPTPPPAAPFPPMTLALAGLAVLAASTSLIPPDVRPWNVSALGALALFAAARLRLPVALAVFAAGMAVKELGVYLVFGFEPSPTTWLCFGLYLALGRAALRATESPLRIGLTAVGASVLFFLITNFGAWLRMALPYERSLAGLMDSYAAGIPFYRGTFLGDVGFSAALFGAHALLSRTYFPAEQVRPATTAVRDAGGAW
ncbi:MAG: hypothetical protein K2V38_14375 [Gemmataceae bacterium]|nr:hypothetical protein [Gemmataceae bacterium]